MEKKTILLLLAMLAIVCFSFAQNNTGAIKVTLTDSTTKESIPFATITVYNGKTQIAVGTTDLDGNCIITHLTPGKYNVKATYVGYEPALLKSVVVNAAKTTYASIKIKQGAGVNLDEVVIADYAVPLIDPDTKSGGTVDRETFQSVTPSNNTTQYSYNTGSTVGNGNAPPIIDPNAKPSQTVTRQSFQQMASKSVNSVVSTQAGVILIDNGSSSRIQVRGSRAGTTNAFVDGERAIGTTNVAEGNAVLYTAEPGGLPAQYSNEKEATVVIPDLMPSTTVPTPAAPQPVSVPTAANNPAYDMEEYGQFKESAYNAVSNQPLSTFAIDVDGASFSNARRMLQLGMLPNKESIRIEEFVNYFPYNYPQPKGEQPFSITTEYAPCPWNASHNLLQVGIKGKEVNFENSPASHLVFLIDVSGSMEDANKLPLLKRAFKLLVKQIRPKDHLSIVVYAGAAGMIIENASGDDKDKIANAIDVLSAGGSTAGGDGINLAYALAEKHYLKNGNNRVILATDGDFNVGVSTEDDLKKLIEDKRKLGIYLSVLGFGEGNIKDNKMETLADKGNGNYYYIDNFTEARKVLVSQFGGTLFTIAKDVKIQVEFNPAAVKEYRLIGYDNRLLAAEDFNDDTKDAGELGSGHCVTALYEIIPAGSADSQTKIDPLKYSQLSTNAANAAEIATIKFRYKETKKQDTTSKLITQVIDNKVLQPTAASANFKLAVGVSEFAMLLRDSQYKGGATFAQAVQLVNAAQMPDPNGYIAGLLDMIKTASELSEPQARKK